MSGVLGAAAAKANHKRVRAALASRGAASQ
jgi:hypothetical protein